MCFLFSSHIIHHPNHHFCRCLQMLINSNSHTTLNKVSTFSSLQEVFQIPRFPCLGVARIRDPPLNEWRRFPLPTNHNSFVSLSIPSSPNNVRR